MQQWKHRSSLFMAACLLALLGACSGTPQTVTVSEPSPTATQHEQEVEPLVAEDLGIDFLALEPVKSTLDIGGGGWWVIEIQDMDEDGSLDLVTVDNPEGLVRIYLNDGLGTSQPDKVLAVDAGPSGLELAGLVLADFDGDGLLDIAVSHLKEDAVSVLFNDGSGQYVARTRISVEEEPTFLRVADLEIDGDIDLIVTYFSSSQISLLRNDGTGNFSADELIQMTAGGEMFAEVSDLNNDAYPDVVVGHPYDVKLSLLLNNSGVLGEPEEYEIGTPPQAISIGDLDDNGSPDLVVISKTGSISVLKNDGTGTFVESKTIEPGGSLSSGLLADMNGDGLLDLLAANDGSFNVEAFVNVGDGSFVHHGDYAAFPVGPRHLRIADIDADGIDELVAAGFARVALFDFAD